MVQQLIWHMILQECKDKINKLLHSLNQNKLPDRFLKSEVPLPIIFELYKISLRLYCNLCKLYV